MSTRLRSTHVIVLKDDLVTMLPSIDSEWRFVRLRIIELFSKVWNSVEIGKHRLLPFANPSPNIPEYYEWSLSYR